MAKSWHREDRLTPAKLLRRLWSESEFESGGFPCDVDDCLGFVMHWADFAACLRCGQIYEWREDGDG